MLSLTAPIAPDSRSSASLKSLASDWKAGGMPVRRTVRSERATAARCWPMRATASSRSATARWRSIAASRNTSIACAIAPSSSPRVVPGMSTSVAPFDRPVTARVRSTIGRAIERVSARASTSASPIRIAAPRPSATQASVMTLSCRALCVSIASCWASRMSRSGLTASLTSTFLPAARIAVCAPSRLPALTSAT